MPGSTMLMSVAVAVVGLLASASVATTTIGLPNCNTTCGDVSVPYPFGLSPGCYLPGFDLTCDRSRNPPRLLLGDGDLRVTEISLWNATVRVNGTAIRMVNDTARPVSHGKWRGLRHGGRFVVSSIHNDLVATGCNVLAELLVAGNNNTITGCASFCPRFGWGRYILQIDRKCSGIGCCQTSISWNLTSYDVRLRQLEESSSELIELVFIADQTWFATVSGELLNFSAPRPTRPEMEVPVVLDWVSGKVGCDGACRSQYSFCYNDTFLRSMCRCKQGYDGNPYITNGCTDLSIGLGISSGAVFILAVLGGILLTRKVKELRKKKQKQKFYKQNRGQLLEQLVSHRADISERMIITLEELKKATNNFDNSRKLGGGGHGVVYKGILSDQSIVAIKKSKIFIQQEIDEFINEVATLSQINHRNIVKLFGCCLETEVPLLVYEFISNGTLYEHLHVEGPRSLSWEHRLRIANGTARALAYINSAISVPIIHRDIKSSNILLDDSLTAKVSDFGASRYIPVDQTGINTAVQGTIGYLDPLYYYTGRLTEKSDVYSFGVILIELLSRKKPFAYMSSNNDSLVVHFVSLLRQENLVQILDPQVVEEGDIELIKDVANLATVCINLRGEDRPTMRQVEMKLEGLIQGSRKPAPESTVDRGSEENAIPMNGMIIQGRGRQSASLYYSMKEESLLP
ncbi:hypothetical protein EJB05_49686, partial [Eragrostis curvula]